VGDLGIWNYTCWHHVFGKATQSGSKHNSGMRNKGCFLPDKSDGFLYFVEEFGHGGWSVKYEKIKR
jgi:hypothetical protein